MAKKSNGSVGDNTVINAIGDDTNKNDSVGTSGEIFGIPVVDPSSATGNAAGNAAAGSGDGGGAKRGRGRPAGAGKSKQKAAPVSVKGIEKILYSAHLALVKFTGVDELEIDNDEAKLLADALTEVSSHYNVAIDPKTMAWLGLAGILGTIYGPRIATYKMRKSIDKKPAKRDENIANIGAEFNPINPMPGHAYQ